MVKHWMLPLTMSCNLVVSASELRADQTVAMPINISAVQTVAEKVSPVEFVRDVEPVLTKAGCNSGGCHGAFSGRGGFRLSLWGFDPMADYDALTTEAQGRRISLAAPSTSLILAK